MATWRTVDETDLAATLSQREIDAFRRDGGVDGSDAVARVLETTVAHVRGWCSMNGAIKRFGPLGTIPASLVAPAMDYAAYRVLTRLASPVNEDRRKARERAEEIFDKIAQGAITPESYSEDDAVADDSRPAASPAFAPPSPARLLD